MSKYSSLVGCYILTLLIQLLNIPPSEVDPVYELSQILCILLLLLLVMGTLFDIKNTAKKLLTILVTLATMLHYYVLYRVSLYEYVFLYPLIVIEENTSEYSAVSPDLGQILVILLLVIWRKEIVRILKRYTKRVLQGTKSSGEAVER